NYECLDTLTLASQLLGFPCWVRHRHRSPVTISHPRLIRWVASNFTAVMKFWKPSTCAPVSVVVVLTANWEIAQFRWNGSPFISDSTHFRFFLRRIGTQIVCDSMMSAIVTSTGTSPHTHRRREVVQCDENGDAARSMAGMGLVTTKWGRLRWDQKGSHF